MSRSFNELIKDFNTIRSYAREFYINGFKHREEFQEKSLRSYDNERRRIESFLSEYTEWEQTAQGKTIRLELKQEPLDTNPLFKLWQTKSFTKNDVFLHFTILDCLTSYESLSLTELTELLHQEYLNHFDGAPTLSELTIRNKLKEYSRLGVLQEIEKEKRLHYQLVALLSLEKKMIPVLHFYKEVLPGGVIGQFLLNKLNQKTENPFTFKHHFIVHSLDEEIVLTILAAITEHRYISVYQYNGKEAELIPLSLYVSTETGRQYLVGLLHKNLLTSIRIDNIKEVILKEPVEQYLDFQEQFSEKKETSWNGSFNQKPLKKLRVLLQILEGYEDYLMTRIAREQRMGISYRIDQKTVVFEIELIDLFAINPFLRTFVGRIISIESTDKEWETLFINDLKELIALYSPSKEVKIDD
ncbi:hypothetical protein [Enterococcus sp. AZ192]|uniref:hypothetical protein n=1 Tax=unclassified Enterococcus TaxID=2608891 RepID=UPI003D29730B